MPLDPIATWREFVAQLEKTVNQAANSAMASDSFREGMHRALLAGVMTHEASHEAMRHLLQALDVPTRDDVAALAECLRSIEARLVQVNAILELSHPEAAAAVRRPMPRLPRTRKPPAAFGASAETAGAAAAATAAATPSAEARGKVAAGKPVPARAGSPDAAPSRRRPASRGSRS